MTVAECREKVESCMDNGSISKWESSFLVGLTDKLDRGMIPSDREQEIVQEIHDKIYGGSRWR